MCVFIAPGMQFRGGTLHDPSKLAKTDRRYKPLVRGQRDLHTRDAQGDGSREPVSPCSVPKGKPFGRRCYAYSLQEIFEHLKLFEGDTRTRAIIGTLAFGGLREGELRGLWGTDDTGTYLQIRRSVWRSIVKERCKNLESGCEIRPAEVPMIAPLRKMLDRVHHGSSWLFPNSLGGPMDLSNLADRVIQPTLQASGLKWHGWHADRRGLATNLKQLGIDDLGDSADIAPR
jgi:integrase